MIIAVFLSSIYAAYVFFVPLISSSLSQLLLFLGTKHVGYLNTDSYGYELSLSNPAYLLNLVFPIFLTAVIFYRNNNLSSLPLFSTVPLIGVFMSLCFSSYALFAYRISFTFYSVFLFILLKYFASIRGLRSLLILSSSCVLLLYNLTISARLSDFSY